MEKHNLNASVRKVVGRKVSTLRKHGLIPSNVFGKKIKSLSISVSVEEFGKVYKEVGETAIINLIVEGEKEARPVLVANIQKDPVTDIILHIDLHQVDLKEKVEAEVPVEVVGESPIEKQSMGTVVQYINEIKVEALPADLPEKFEINAETLTEVDQVVKISDLGFDKAKVEVKMDIESIVVKVEPPQKIVEEVAPAPVEGEATAEGATPAEGTTPADGEAKPEESKASEK